MYNINPIGFIASPYQEKFGVPRQPNLVPAGKGTLELIAPYNHPDSARGLEQFSHLWLLFIFDHNIEQGWHNTVRPPRLGGNEKLGVFATRSTFRPNPIGLSAVELHDIYIDKNKVILKLGSVDLVDGTPIVDIKPYIPYSDSHPNALAGYAQNAPQPFLDVEYSSLANEKLQSNPALKELITQVIRQDPRPAYKRKNKQVQKFAITLCKSNIHWQVENNIALVTDVTF